MSSMMPSSNSRRCSYASTEAACGITARRAASPSRLAAQFLDLVLGEPGQDRRVPGRREGAAAGDLDRVLDRLGQVGEQRRHLLRLLK